jgi:hypothetical protein
LWSISQCSEVFVFGGYLSRGWVQDQNNKSRLACRKIEARFVKEWGKNKAAASETNGSRKGYKEALIFSTISMQTG